MCIGKSLLVLVLFALGPVSHAYAYRDDVELERFGTRLGPARLSRQLFLPETSAKDRLTTVRAMVLSGRLHPDLRAPLLAGLVSALARSNDAALLLAGAEAAEELATRLGDEVIEATLAYDRPQTEALLLGFLENSAVPAPARAMFLYAAAAFAGPHPAPNGPLRQALRAAMAQGESTIREAAMKIHSRLFGAEELLVFGQNEDPLVAIPALSAYCDFAAPDSLSKPIIDRVRSLATGSQPITLRQQLLSCLSPKDPASRALAKKGPKRRP